MESTRRIIAKAATWQATGLVAMTALGYLVSGSLEAAGQFAVGSCAFGFATFFVHEKIWGRIRWGRQIEE